MFYIYMFIYNLIWLVFLFLISPYIIYLFLSGKKELILNRFGIYNIPVDDYIWIHSASLGETKVALNFIKEFRKKSMEPIFLTTVTSSGYNFAKKDLLQNTYLGYAPVDFIPVLLFLINRLRVQKLILTETELWPSYIISNFLNSRKIYIINSRISDKTYKTYLKYKKFFKNIINKIALICVQSKEYKKRFLELGGGLNNQILVVNNLKYDFYKISDPNSIKKENIFNNKRVFTAGSIREGEEELVVNVYKKLKLLFSDLVLVIAPRHLKNVNKIKNILNREKISCMEYSKINNNFTSNVLIIDVLGKLFDIYKSSDIVFVGGSLVNKGGQNIIEPAVLGKPVIFGEYMSNFKDIAEAFIENKAGLEVKNENELYDAVKHILEDKNFKDTLVKNVLNLIKTKQGGTQETIRHLFEI
jgi:3-deoxy-D-manno-octulosonic-acid transferase